MTTRRLAALAFLVVLAGTTLAACGGDDDSVTAPPRDTGATTTSGAGTTTADTTPSGTVAPTAPGVDLTVTFLRGDRVGVAHRRVARLTDLFIEGGARMMLVDTEADNARAIAFFEREGFGHPVEHLYLSRNLTGLPGYRRKRGLSSPGKSPDDVEDEQDE